MRGLLGPSFRHAGRIGPTPQLVPVHRGVYFQNQRGCLYESWFGMVSNAALLASWGHLHSGPLGWNSVGDECLAPPTYACKLGLRVTMRTVGTLVMGRYDRCSNRKSFKGMTPAAKQDWVTCAVQLQMRSDPWPALPIPIPDWRPRTARSNSLVEALLPLRSPLMQ